MSEIDSFLSGKYDSQIAADKQPESEIDSFLKDAPEQDGSFARGFKKAGQSMKMTAQLATGDTAGTAQTVQEASDYAQANPGMPEGRKLMEAWDKGDGITGAIGNVASQIKSDYDGAKGFIPGVRAVGRDARAMGEGIVEQVPNMIAPTAGMLAGGAAGGVAGSEVPIIGNAIGAVVGGWAGASAGNALVEGGDQIQTAIQKAGIDTNDTQAVEAFLDANKGQLLKQTAVKGGIIGAVDTATAGLAHWLLTGPGKAATGRALSALGVDAADDVAVKAAKNSPEFDQLIKSDATYQASQQGAGHIARNVAAAAVEPAGEFAGEYVGQGAATGDWDAKNAALEALSSVGQSGAMFAGQKAIEYATQPKAGEASADGTLIQDSGSSREPANTDAPAPSIDPGYEDIPPSFSDAARAAGDYAQAARDIKYAGELYGPGDTTHPVTGERIPAPKPSEQMGIDPTAGPLSEAAAHAVDTGVSDHFAQQPADNTARPLADLQSSMQYFDQQEKLGGLDGDLVEAKAKTQARIDSLQKKDTGNSSVIDEASKDDNADKFRKIQGYVDAGTMHPDDANNLVSRAMRAGDIAGDKAVAGDYLDEAAAKHEGKPYNYASTIDRYESGAVGKMDIKAAREALKSRDAVEAKSIDQQLKDKQAAQSPAATAAADPAVELQRRLDYINQQGKRSGWNREMVAERESVKTQLAQLQPQSSTPTSVQEGIQQAQAKAKESAKKAIASGGNEADAMRAATDSLISDMANNSDISISTEAPAAVAAAKQERATQPTAAEVKAITAKQIPQMTDAELQIAANHYGPEHKRAAKLQKEMQRRGVQPVQTAQESLNGQQPAQQTPAAVPVAQTPVQNTAQGAESVQATTAPAVDHGARWESMTPEQKTAVLTQPGGWSTNKGGLNVIGKQLTKKGWDGIPENTRGTIGKLLEKYSPVDVAAHAAATSPQNNLPEPTQAQKEAGNYTKGHVNVQGLDITVENPRGSTRTGQREDGSTWSHEMSDHYGYIKRTSGADGEQVDVYIGPQPEAEHVYVVDQIDQKTGKFDEHKAMIGFRDQASAEAAYRSNFDQGWKVGPVHPMSMNKFKSWLKEGDTTKPASQNQEQHSASPVAESRAAALEAAVGGVANAQNGTVPDTLAATAQEQPQAQNPETAPKKSADLIAISEREIKKAKNRVQKARREAEKASQSPISVSDKVSAQNKIKEAEMVLRKQRARIFDIEDAIRASLKAGNLDAFTPELQSIFPETYRTIKESLTVQEQPKAQTKAQSPNGAPNKHGLITTYRAPGGKPYYEATYADVGEDGRWIKGTVAQKNSGSKEELEAWLKDKGVDAPEDRGRHMKSGNRTYGDYINPDLARTVQNKDGSVDYYNGISSAPRKFPSVAALDGWGDENVFGWPEVRDRLTSGMDKGAVNYDAMSWNEMKQEGMDRGIYKVGMDKESLLAALKAPQDSATAEKSAGDQEQPQQGRFSNNKLFTEDKVAAARARMKGKFGQLNSGIDPEVLQAGITPKEIDELVEDHYYQEMDDEAANEALREAVSSKKPSTPSKAVLEKDDTSAQKAPKPALNSQDIDGFIAANYSNNKMGAGRARKILETPVRNTGTGEVTSRAVWVGRKLQDGGKLTTTEENKIKDMSRLQYFRATGAEQEAHERRIKAGGKKTVYNIENSGSGTSWEITKTEYDYANFIKDRAPSNTDQYGQNLNSLSERGDAWSAKLKGMSDEDLNALYEAMHLAGGKNIDQLAALQQEHPDDLDAGYAELTASAKKAEPESVDAARKHLADVMRQIDMAVPAKYKGFEGNEKHAPKDLRDKLKEARARLKTATGQATSPEKAPVSTVDGQKHLAYRASRIATLRQMNDEIRKLDPSEAWHQDNIDDAKDLDALQDSISETLFRLNKEQQAKTAAPPISEEQHVEKGKIEEVTGEVIRESIAKSALKTPFSVKTATAWITKEVDAAIAKAPTEVSGDASHATIQFINAKETVDSLKSAKRRGHTLTKNEVKELASAEQELPALRSKMIEAGGHIIFDIPGDGKFRVKNTKDNLTRFKANIIKAMAYKGAGPLRETASQNGPMTTLKDMIGENEMENAYHFAKQHGDVKFGLGTKVVAYGMAEDVNIEGIDAFVGLSFEEGRGKDKIGLRNQSDFRSKKLWYVIEPRTGLAIGDGAETKEKAVSLAKLKVKSGDVQKIKAHIAETAKPDTMADRLAAWAKQENIDLSDEAFAPGSTTAKVEASKTDEKKPQSTADKAASYKNGILIAADSVEKLRPQDVDRVLAAAYEQGEDQLAGVADYIYKNNVKLYPEIISFFEEVAGFLEDTTDSRIKHFVTLGLRRRNAADLRDSIAKKFGDDLAGLQLEGSNERFAFLLPDASEQGKVRATYFDANGLSGHTSYDSYAKALDDVIQQGYRKESPYALDRMSKLQSFKDGNEWADKIHAMHNGKITWAEMVSKAEKKQAPKDQPVTASKTPIIDQHNAAMRLLNEGKLTPAAFKAEFDAIDGKADAIKAELATMTKADLLTVGGGWIKGRYAGETKPRIIDAIYRKMLGDYIIGDSLTYGMGKGAYETALRQQVEGITAEKLANYAEGVAKRLEDRALERAAVEAGIENPKTVEDFRAVIRQQKAQGRTFTEARMTLSPEQRAEYDRLEAETTREARLARKRTAKASVNTAGQTVGGEIIATKHTKKGHDLFVVQLAERVSKEDYGTLNNSAKRLGGYYSSFRGAGAVPGFQFTDRDNADAFLKLAAGDTSAAKDVASQRRDAFEDDRSQSAAERLNEMATRLDDRADEVLNADRKTNTHRRAAMAARAESAANADKALAETMRNLSKAIEQGKAEFLDAVRQKSQVELLEAMVNRAKNEEIRARYPNYGDQLKHAGEKPTNETADHAEFPSFTVYRSDLASLARKMSEVEGTKKLGQRLMSVADDVTDAYITFAKENLLKVSGFSRGDGMADFPSVAAAEKALKNAGLVGKAIVLPVKRGLNRIVLSPSEAINKGIWGGDNDKRITLSKEFGMDLVQAIGRRGNKTNGLSVPWQLDTAADRLKSLDRMGIETPAEFRSALREFIALRQAPAADDKVKEMERAMIGRKSDGLDFFPTPSDTADAMVDAAELQEGMTVLEPSAGMGHIAERIRAAGIEPDVIEMGSDRADLLKAKGFNWIGPEFMQASGQYDRIIMNPPFSDRRDAEHVRHAYDLLKPGGRLVSIMGEGVFFGKDKKAQEFRDWLENVGGTDEKLNEGTFLDPSLPVNTGTNARMVVIDKPESAEAYSAPAQNLSDESTEQAVSAPNAEEDSNDGEEAVKPTNNLKNNIQDFGEKLEGARKDYTQKLNDAQTADTASEPLSKSWPEPDYNKLLEAGADPFVVGWVHACRDEVPTKPKRSWRLAGWVKQVEALRDTSIKLLSGEISKEKLLGSMSKAEHENVGRTVGGRAELYERLGHDTSFKGITVSRGEFSLYRGVPYSPAKVIWTVGPDRDPFNKQAADGNTREEAIEKYVAKHQNNAETVSGNKAKVDSGKATKFDMWSLRGSSTIYLGKKIGKNYIKLKSFDSQAAAREYRSNNQQELEDLLKKYKETPFERNSENRPRVGADHRNGSAVTPEAFDEAFGFRGVQFGNYVEGSRRQQDLDNAYDALSDLAALVNIPTKALSLNKKLGLAFGARGKGGLRPAAAHYEPDTVVINLTKGNGAGSLAHEWFHAVDNYFAKLDNSTATSAMMTNGSINRNIRPEMVAAFKELTDTIRKSDMRRRSIELDKRRTTPYWATYHEMAARAFESYVIQKLQSRNASNDYLANIVGEDYWKASEALLGHEGEDTYPYPTAPEMESIGKAFDNFIGTLKTKETESGVALFSRGNNGDVAVNGAGNRTSVSKVEADETIARVASHWADGLDGIRLLDGYDDLPASIQRYAEKKGIPRNEIKGVFHNGKVLLVRENLRDAQHVEETLFHEAYGHKGLAALFGLKHTGELNRLYMAMGGSTGLNKYANKYGINLRSYVLDLRNEPEDVRNAVLVEELLAHMAQDQKPSVSRIAKEILGKIRAWFRAKGFPFLAKANDADLQYILSQSRKAVIEGKGSNAGMRFALKSPVWRSTLTDEVSALQTKSAPSLSWKQQITSLINKGKVKQAEIDAVGLFDWLDMQEGKVDKNAVVDFLDTNGVQVQETMLGGGIKLPSLPDGWYTEQDPEGGWSVYDEDDDIMGEGSSELLAIRDSMDASELAHAEMDGGTKFSQYVLPGGENYRELLLTLPATPDTPPAPYGKIEKLPNGKYLVTAPSGLRELFPTMDKAVAETERLGKYYNKPTPDASTFKSSHYDQPNILAHVRFNERTDAGGKRVLFIEELQSDWAQKGRKEGFNYYPVEKARHDALREKWLANKLTEEEGAEFDQLSATGRYNNTNVPSAPFVTSTDAWVSLSMKRMIAYAAENGFDRIAWTTGEQQAGRYDLSKQVDEINVQRRVDNNTGETSKVVHINVLSGSGNVSMEIDSSGDITDVIKGSETLKGKNISDVVGKELSKNIIESDVSRGEKTISGDGLKVGGEGMKSFYDKIVPKVAKEITKKMGGQLTSVNLTDGRKKSSVTKEDIKDAAVRFMDGDIDAEEFIAETGLSITEEELDDAIGGERDPSRFESQAELFADNVYRHEQGEIKQQPGFDITPEMRSAATAGLPLFSRTNATRGAYEKRIDELFSGNPSGRGDTIVLDEADVLSVLGQSNKPLVLKESKVHASLESHPKMTAAQWKKVPEWLENPVAVFESDTHPGDFVFIPDEMVGGNVVFITINPDASVMNLDVHVVTNAYDRRDYHKTPFHRWMQEGKLLYVDLQKSSAFDDTSGLQLPRVYRQARSLNKNIKTDTDLGKYREARNTGNSDGRPMFSRGGNQDIQDINENENPDVFSRSSIKAISAKATEELNKTFSVPGKLNWWHKTVGTMYNLAERSPAFKRVFDAAQGYIDDVSHYANDAAEAAPKLLPRLDTWRDIMKSPITGADNTAISKPIFEGTLAWARDAYGLPVKVRDLAAQAESLSVDEKAERLIESGKVPNGIVKAWRSMSQENYEKAVNERFEAQMLKPGIVWRDKELRSMFGLNDEQISQYHEFRNSVDRSLDTMARADMLRFGGEDVQDLKDAVMDAENVHKAALILRKHLKEMAKNDPDRAEHLLDVAHGMAERAGRVDQLQAEGYAPLSRFGKYTVDVVENGTRQYFGLFETRREANAMAAMMRKEFGIGSVSQGTLSEEEYKMFAGITPESMELFGNMLGLDSSGDEAKDKAFQDFLRLTKNNRSAMKRLIHRQGIAGYSENVPRVLAQFIYSNARQTAAGLNMGELGDAINAIPKEEGELKDHAIRLGEYVKNPQEEAQAIRGLLFAQYLGGSIASAFVNMTQPIAVSFPYLSQYGGIKKSASALSKAARDMATKGFEYEPDLREALHLAEEDGTVSPQEVHDLMAQASGRGSLRSGDGTQAGDTIAKAQNGLARMSVAWGKVFGAAEQANRRVTFIAAYRIAKENKMDNPAEFARKAVVETQFQYSKANKMVWGRGAVGGTLMTFKTYSIAYLELLHRMYTQGGPEGKKAALLALGVMMIMGGAGGLPFEEDLQDAAEGLAQMLGYNISIKQQRRELLEEAFGADAALFIEHGITGLPGMPLDVSGRLGMGNLIPGTGLLKSKTDHTRDVLELLGPGGDFLGRAFSGVGKALTGDVAGGVLEASPLAVRNAAKGIDMAASGMYKDQKGYKVLDTNPLEAGLKFAGFQPNSVARIQEANAINQQKKSFYNLTASEIRSQWAQGIFDGDPSKVQKARARIADWNEENPDMRMIVTVPSVMHKVNEMKKTKDERIAATAPKSMRAQMRAYSAEVRSE